MAALAAVEPALRTASLLLLVDARRSAARASHLLNSHKAPVRIHVRHGVLTAAMHLDHHKGARTVSSCHACGATMPDRFS
jgi:hypothetical protein